MRNIFGVLFLLGSLGLVLAIYGGIFWLHRIASRRRLRDGGDAMASLHRRAGPDIQFFPVDGDSPHPADATFHEGGGEFGGAGASESYDSGGGDSGDGGGDGGGD